ncbi:PREDICTED: myb-like protein Q isoform X1 [Drosophila arizonae]|uniref:Myb-like protein Q isoform X1 n=1 Tax=Drosophila arizonae TaxID=7263 RepID=A0ABM1PAX4_DROAR|nr:PREDICTED: myb-like protein Q isoform X1 [Drosophila arizonae]XP_017864359.1 PREDICTED: myb-like protein Q isoform X1 [Drosophila arizonae]XP_017864360.1 PREDICTED: myb-like protein Q isoform X1 [Drosophila arizonae]
MPKEDPFVNRAQLLKAIKKYPEIWDSNNKLHLCRSVTSPMWNEIAEQFGGHVPTVKLQSIWSQMKYHYHNLVHRQILHKERFNTKWEHFEPMSFMYNITVAKIVGAQANSSNSEASSPNEAAHQVGGSPPVLPPPPLPSATHGRGRPSGSFSWLQPTVAAPPAIAPQPAAPPAGISASPELPHLIEQPAAHGMTYTAFTGLVPPAAVTVEATTTPMRKLGRPSSLHNSMRGRIIDAIKARPSLWAGRQRSEKGQGQSRTSAVWKEAANEMGLTPTLMQTRWSIIKQRYVDELQKERHAQYAQQGFRSNWEHFERMSFMREILLRKVDEREQTREHIQEMVSEQQQHQHQQQQQQQPHSLAIGHAQPQAHPLQLYRPPGLAEHSQDLPIGQVQQQLAQHGAHLMHSQHLLHHHHNNNHHPHLHLHHQTPGAGRRRVKHESDLEWDPFEMILHVQGNGEPAAN